MWAASYFAELSGGATSLAVTPVQHRVQTVGDPTAIRRLYASLGLRLFYADASDPDAALATAPAVSDVGGEPGRLDGHLQCPDPRHEPRRG